MSRRKLERALQRIWYTKPGALSLLLLPLSWLFGAIVALRRFAYRRGLRRSYRIRVPVIVVGNLTVGGAGKTPLVDWLVAELVRLGRRPGIVSRGYGRTDTAVMRVRPDSDYREAGDEALMLARRTGVPVFVAADRVAAATAIANTGVDVIVSDDGLQHYRLRRDLEITVVEAQRGLGNERLLPAGPLREPARRLQEADMVFVNGAAAVAAACKVTGHHAELVPGEAVSLRDGSGRPLADFAGQRVWAVAGIGNPARFHEMLRTAGIDPAVVDVADHGRTDLAGLCRRRDWPVLMTEKDAVKYPDCAGDAWYVPVSIRMAETSRRTILNQLAALRAQSDPK